MTAGGQSLASALFGRDSLLAAFAAGAMLCYRALRLVEVPRSRRECHGGGGEKRWRCGEAGGGAAAVAELRSEVRTSVELSLESDSSGVPKAKGRGRLYRDRNTTG